MKIAYWSDYNCPYCYIAHTRLNNAIKELKLDDVDFEIHSFELDPTAPKDVQSTTLDRFADKYNITKDEAQMEINTITQMGQEEGLDFKYASTLFTNSFDAHRLMKYAATKLDYKMLEKLHEQLFEAYFVENKKLADIEVLLDIAVCVGLDSEEVKTVLESDEYSQEVRLDENTAYSLGIHAVPYYIFNNKYIIPGALSTDDFKNILNKVLNEENIGKSNAKQCDGDTCRI